MDYPRTVVLGTSGRLKDFLNQKGALILHGRELTDDIEKKEKEMEDAELAIQEEEKKADITDLSKEAEAVTAEFNAVVARMEDIKQRTYERIKKNMNPALYERYEAAKKAKDEMEIARNKVALKIQKIKDRIVPIARKLMAPHIQNKYEDFNGVELDQNTGQVVGSIFSHLDDFEKRFEKKQSK